MRLLGDVQEGLSGDPGTQGSKGERKGLMVHLNVGSCSFVYGQISLPLRYPQCRAGVSGVTKEKTSEAILGLTSVLAVG